MDAQALQNEISNLTIEEAKAYRDQILAAQAEKRLLPYIKLMWRILEPGRKFKEGYAVEAICEFLEAVTAGQIDRGLINVPPGCMKSLTTCVFWPTWEWGPMDMPWRRYIAASYAEHLSLRDNRKGRQLLSSNLFKQFWGDRFAMASDQNAKGKYENDHAGWKMATSTKGVGTGERADRFIIDDPHSVKTVESETVREEQIQWFSEVVPTRINDEDSAILVIMQRVHERDVSGLILADELGYDHLMLPMKFEPERKCYMRVPFSFSSQEPERVLYDTKEHAWRTEDSIWASRTEDSIQSVDQIEFDISQMRAQEMYPVDWRTEPGELLWPERFTEQLLEEKILPPMRAYGGVYAEAGQMQQRPVPRGGSIFNTSLLNFMEPAEFQSCVGRTVRGWDLAGSTSKRSPYTASVKMMIDQQGRVIISNVTRDRLLPGPMRTHIGVTANADGLQVMQDLPQDPGQAGKAQKADLAKVLQGKHFRFSLESGDKEVRAAPLAAQVDAGNVWLVRGSWNDAFVDEMKTFPMGAFADQIDGCSRAYFNLNSQRSAGAPVGPKVIHI